MSKRFVIIVGLFVFLFILGYGIWWYFFRGTSSVQEQQVIEIPDWYKIDKDGDTIPDEKERELGTDQNDDDTDGDTVSDQLEIDVYKTDPRNPDTDEDGYRDGVEIIKGFDPLVKAQTKQ